MYLSDLVPMRSSVRGSVPMRSSEHGGVPMRSSEHGGLPMRSSERGRVPMRSHRTTNHVTVLCVFISPPPKPLQFLTTGER